MKIINYKDIDESFFQRIDFETLEAVNKIISKVRLEKDNALIELSKQFNDGDFKSASDFVVSKTEIEKALDTIDKDVLTALKKAIENVREFSIKQLESIKNLEFKKENSLLAHKIIPLKSVLFYCPGGNIPLLSSC